MCVMSHGWMKLRMPWASPFIEKSTFFDDLLLHLLRKIYSIFYKYLHIIILTGTRHIVLILHFCYLHFFYIFFLIIKITLILYMYFSQKSNTFREKIILSFKFYRYSKSHIYFYKIIHFTLTHLFLWKTKAQLFHLVYFYL